MKELELTIEQKAKAYDEVVKKARTYYNKSTCLRNTLETLENIFPELKESEDERIRKNLIRYFSAVKGFSTLEYNYGISNEEVVAWLEKQKRLYSDYEESELRRGLLCHLKELQNIEDSKGLPIKAKATYDDWIAWLEK